MTVEELLRKGKSAIRKSETLSSLFADYFKEILGGTASFCCTFSDFDKLRIKIFKHDISMGLNKFVVNYRADKVLYFVEDKKVIRRYAKRADDEFIEKFIELHDETKFPDVHKMIVEIGQEGTEGSEGTEESEGSEESEGTEGTEGTEGSEGSEGSEETEISAIEDFSQPIEVVEKKKAVRKPRAKKKE